jgi:hypothetical protein
MVLKKGMCLVILPGKVLQKRSTLSSMERSLGPKSPHDAEAAVVVNVQPLDTVSRLKKNKS